MPIPVLASIELAVALVGLAADPNVREAVTETAGKASSAASDAAKNIVSSPVAQNAVAVTTAMGTKATNAVKGVAEARAQAKALSDARKQILDEADASFSAKELIDDLTGTVKGSALGLVHFPGYYVIASYKGKPGKDGTGKYSDVFVGRSEDVADSVTWHLNGEGNCEVYADIKSGKNIYVYVFRDIDEADDNNETLGKLILALGAFESHNAKAFSEEFKQRIMITVDMPCSSSEEVSQVLLQALPNMKIVEEELCGNDVIKLRFLGTV